ncbi:MAG: hypothetical protein KBC42_00080 [Candidatus Pacebacteria bacterium]|nr:hypothetical protein [Candidatus Paceibacterota bacterium]MBP9780306.1 hypothetical protein [Candidatus Paceibacterota bacterium]
MEKTPLENDSIVTLNDAIRSLQNKNLEMYDAVNETRNLIYSHRQSLGHTVQPKSIMESRFMPAKEAFEKGMASCGVTANISATILRELGFQVKLIHGESEDSVDHAWIAVLNKDTNEWDQFDLTREDLSIPETHKVKEMVYSFEDIREQIENDHKTLRQRRKERGFE